MLTEKVALNKLYDVAIVGGGIVGLTLALALARSKFEVVLIEKSSMIQETVMQSDLRVSAINLASQAIFKSLDVWSRMKLRVSPFEKICVFEPSQTYALTFDRSAVNKSHLGFIVEHQLMLRVLNEALLSHDHIDVFYQSAVQALNLGAEKATLTLETGKTISSRLVVGADGMHSRLRELAGITMIQRDYHQVALIAEIHTEKSHQKTAWQCFRSTGPLAFLPLKDKNICSIVWSTSQKEAYRLQNLPKEIFESELQTAFENRLGSLCLKSARLTFPLKMRYAQSFVKSRLALVGDAIHTIHPLAGQGLNLGLLDAACLAETIQNARDKASDIGDYSVLRHYVRWRKTHHLITIAAMEFFKQGFAAEVFPFPWLRGQFLHQFNRRETLKRFCMNFATGLKGDLPKICER